MNSGHHTIETPRSSPGAIAMIRVVHPHPEKLGLLNPTLSSVRLAKLFDIDEGVIARWDEESIVLMPHGGIAIVRRISDRLVASGVPLQSSDEPLSRYGEAESEIEASMLDALANASSPLAVDLLLDQPRRWAALGIHRLDQVDSARAEPGKERVLGRLIDPPIVVAVGRANIGKSTLINALSGEHVAIVADSAGTTRDHVGVLVNLGGLVVRWIDTPGIDERIEGGQEVEIAMRVVAKAQLVLHLIDQGDPDGVLDERIERAISPGAARLRVGTRGDLGAHRCRVDVHVSITHGGQMSGIETLVERVREILVPERVLADPSPWRFWAR